MADLLPLLKARFTDANGAPLAGGLLYSYAAGTTTPAATFTDETEVTPNTNPVVLDANGEANVWVSDSRSYKFVLTDSLGNNIFTQDMVKVSNGGGGTGGLPSGGATGSVLAKSSATDGDVSWQSFGYSGYSARFSANFTSTNLNDTLSQIINLQYAGPLVSLAATGSGSIYENGFAITSVPLTATITKRSNNIAAVRFYKDGSLIHTDSSPSPGGGTDSYTWSGSFSTSSTFSVQVDDASGGGGPTTATASQAFSFVYPYYYGNGASGKTPSQVAALTKSIIASTATLPETMTASSGDVFYFAYPATYGSLTSILDVNGFETITDWTASTGNITGLDGNAVSYKIYQFNNPVVAGTYTYTFKR